MSPKYAIYDHSCIFHMHPSMLENTSLKQFLKKDIFKKENSAKASGFLSVFRRITNFALQPSVRNSKKLI